MGAQCLDRAQPFLARFELALPAVRARDRATHLHAGGKPGRHERLGNSLSFLLTADRGHDLNGLHHG